MEVICNVCGITSHNLKPHFIGGRAATCSVTLSEYRERYPEALVTSPQFDLKMAELTAKKKSTAIDIFNLTPKRYSVKTLFGVDLGPPSSPMATVMGFEEKHILVPEIDPEYKFPEEATKVLLMGLFFNKPTMVHGPTGSGKTTIIEQIAARINYPTMRINHHADMYSYDIAGQMKVINGETVFEHGPLPYAMVRPMILIMDEWDAINPEIGMMYQPVLERKHDGCLGNLVLTADSGTKVQSNPYFRIAATSNTCGLGDDKGHYQGTSVQNLAFVSRFQLRVKLDYLDPKHETEILIKKFPDLDKVKIAQLVQVAGKIREQYEAGRIDVPFSLRDLINWAHIYSVTGGNAEKSIQYTCTSILPFSDAKTISELVQRVMGGTSTRR